MIRPDDSRTSRRPILAVTLPLIVAIAGCSEQNAGPPPAPPTLVESPAPTKAATKAIQPGSAGYSGKGGGAGR